MSNWQPTKGNWHDSDYDIRDAEWVLALRYAEKQYERAGTVWEYTVGRVKAKMPYAMFVRNVMQILIEEAHISDDEVLTLCALARVGDMTGCSPGGMQGVCSENITEELNRFPRRGAADLTEYYAGVFGGDHTDTAMGILLAELLFILRQETCPCNDWEADVRYYQAIEALVDAYRIKTPHATAWLLCNKIKEQLAVNQDTSRNRNQTSEELYAGWNE